MKPGAAFGNASQAAAGLAGAGIERVGGSQTLKGGRAVIAATNRDLDWKFAGSFRAIFLSPERSRSKSLLRDRKERYSFAGWILRSKISQRMGRKIQSVSRAVYEQLHQYDWPGNVRELANLLERSVILCQSDVPAETSGRKPHQASLWSRMKSTLEEAERRLILRA
jgi:transcriptional regulator with GAF, ATPase, and Fis domain